MSQSPVVLGHDDAGTEIAAAVRDLVGQRLASVVMTNRGQLGARDGFVRGIETAWNLFAAAGAEACWSALAGCDTAGSVTSADSAPEVTSTGTMA